MMIIHTFTFLVALVSTCAAFVVVPSVVCRNGVQNAGTMWLKQSISNDNNISIKRSDSMVERRQWLKIVGTASMIGCSALISSESALADVSDGTALPQGAQQFSRVVRLKNDIASVNKRLTTGANEIDAKEWDNINKFLRDIYSVSENDMKFVAKGISNPDNKARAIATSEQLKKYAQAGDVSVSKRDTSSLSGILDTCSNLVGDFLDCLRDVPDEI